MTMVAELRRCQCCMMDRRKDGDFKFEPWKCDLCVKSSRWDDFLTRRWLGTALLIFVLALLVRCVVGLQPYSGQATPRMYGDFEAQRHWMELTVALPPQEWYRHSSLNDLQYWGLDYPPLTAYHSWLCGKLGLYVLPEAFIYHKSRGFESPKTTLFMRGMVLVADLLVYLPACFIATRALMGSASQRREGSAVGIVTRRTLLTLFLCLHPCLLLIDHGHFQFNGVALGLAMLSIASLAKDRYFLAAFLFSLALNYKQMLLYYSPAFFVYILACCFRNKSAAKGVLSLLGVSAVVGITFAAIWAPWLLAGWDSTRQVLHRLFPFERGLFEDKVANFWCSLSVFYKAQALHTTRELQQASTALTALAFLPSVALLFRRPSPTAFLYSVVICALAFFLFSFQVHEKAILLCSVPALLLLMGLPACSQHPLAGPEQWLVVVVGQLQVIALYSMYPLFVKDRLVEAYGAVMVCLVVLHFCVLRKMVGIWRFLLMVLSTLGVGALHVLPLYYTPPARYPDLLTLACTGYCSAHFLLFLLALTGLQCTSSPQKATKVE